MIDDEYERLCEKKLNTKEIFNGTVLHVQDDNVCLPNGKSAHRELIRHIGAVCILPLTKDNHVVVERQYRYPVDSVLTEIPAGKLDYSYEDRLSAAKRELNEETGYTADEWICLGDFYPAPAYSDEKITMYIARSLHTGIQKLDADEFLDVQTVSLHELINNVMNGKITDAKTQLALLKAWYWLLSETEQKTDL